MKNELEVIQNINFTTQIIESNVFFMQFKEDSYCGAEDFKDLMEDYKYFGGGQPMRVLADFPPNASISSEGRTFMVESQLQAVAVAVVFHTLAQRILFNVYQKSRIKRHPVKGFPTKEKALEWLQSL